MPGQFIDDAEPQFIDDAGSPLNSSMDAGIGSVRQPGPEPTAKDKLLSALSKRANALKGMTPLGPMGMGGTAYRAITGEAPPSWVPEPTVEGAVKGLSNIVAGPARLQAFLGKKAGDITGIDYLKRKYGQEFDLIGQGARSISEVTGQQEGAPTQSISGQMIGESAPFLASLPAQGASKLPLAMRLLRGPVEGAAVSMGLNPQERFVSPEQYAQAQAETGKMGALVGGVAGVGAELANPLSRLLAGRRPKTDAAGLAPELQSRVGAEEAPYVFQEDLRRAYELDKAESSKPFEALRALDKQQKPTPNVELFGGQTSFKGKRFSNLLGPNDDVIVAKTPEGEEAGYLWLTKEPDGFSVRKVEVDPKFRRQGIATYLNDQAEEAFGPYKGATDYTAEGKAFRESIGKPKGQEIKMDTFTSKIDELQKELVDLGADESDPVLKELGGFAERIGRSKEKGWARALDVSKRLNDAITQAEGSKDNYRKMMLTKAKRSLEEGLAQYPEYAEAKAIFKEKMSPWLDKGEGASFLKRVMESPTPDKELAKVAKMSGDEAKVFSERLSERGKDAVKSSMLSDLLQRSEGDPLVVAKALDPEKRPESWSVFFQGEEGKRLDGLYKLMKYAHRTGVTVGVSGGAAGATVAGPYAPLFGAWIGKKYLAKPLSKGAAKVFETDAMQRLLLEAGKLSEDSPELGKLLQRIPALSGTAKNDRLKAMLGGYQ